MLDEDFYAYFNVAPIGLLSDCQYDNEFRLGVQYGDDICDFVDADPEVNHCSKCPKSKQEKLYYPPITDDLIINFLLLCTVENLGTDCYYTNEDREIILKYIIEKSKESESYTKRIKELLTAQVGEYSKR